MKTFVCKFIYNIYNITLCKINLFHFSATPVALRTRSFSQSDGRRRPAPYHLPDCRRRRQPSESSASTAGPSEPGPPTPAPSASGPSAPPAPATLKETIKQITEGAKRNTCQGCTKTLTLLNTHVFLPCGHRTLCTHCALKWVQEQPDTRTDPNTEPERLFCPFRDEFERHISLQAWFSEQIWDSWSHTFG